MSRAQLAQQTRVGRDLLHRVAQFVGDYKVDERIRDNRTML